MKKTNLGLAFQRITEEFPDQIAIQFSREESYTYSELNALVNQAARQLKQLGFYPEDVVCIAGDKTVDVFVYQLACIKTGCIYSFFDPASPQERLRKVFSKCEPSLIIANNKRLQQFRDPIEESGAKILELDEANQQERQSFEAENLALTGSLDSDLPAYVMFTSGSTGFPKGAVMTHQNVLNLIDWSIKEFGFGPGEKVTNANAIFFDNSVFDIYSALFSGATLVPFTKEEVVNPRMIIDKIDDLECTSWFSVPSMLIFLQTMKVFTPERMKSMKRIIFGGEGYPKAKLKALFDLYGERTKFYNVYGPTECTCICSVYPVSKKDFSEKMNEFLPLGKLIDGFEYVILTEDLNRATDGQEGNLCLMGDNVGLGYYGDPEITTEHFRTSPVDATARIYMTGDLAYFNPEDQLLYICGRIDNQVKHMGYRIELEEIENAICQLAHIEQAGVFHTEVNGMSKLAAVIQSSEEKTEADLRRQLQVYLPYYMIPNKMFFENELPKNANGKLDRKALLTKYEEEI